MMHYHPDVLFILFLVSDNEYLDCHIQPVYNQCTIVIPAGRNLTWMYATGMNRNN